MKLFLLFSILLTAAVSCSHKSDATMTAKSEVLKIQAKWDKAFNTDDLEGLVSLYAPSAVVSPGNGKIVKGHDGIRALFKGFLGSGAGDHKIEFVHAEMNGDTLFQVSKWSAIGGAGKDGKRPKFGGVLMNTYTKNSSGQWVSRSHVWNVLTN